MVQKVRNQHARNLVNPRLGSLILMGAAAIQARRQKTPGKVPYSPSFMHTAPPFNGDLITAGQIWWPRMT